MERGVLVNKVMNSLDQDRSPCAQGNTFCKQRRVT